MALAHLVAWLDFYRPAQRAQTQWLVSLLDPQPVDDVLDVLAGSGYSTAVIASRLQQGRVVGVDPSKLMLNAAYRHLRRHLRTGQASLVRAEPLHLPRFDVAFDKVLLRDSPRLASELGAVLSLLRTRMTPGGRIVAAAQPQERSAIQKEGARLAAALTTAGFAHVETYFGPLACAAGRLS
jgi:ubiquinone/menaquinone biosynthesis C-methylase UbiE